MSKNHVIIAGMPRSATTYLYHVAQKHPDIFLPYLKESNFFVTNQSRGAEWYWSLFAGAAPEQTSFDISPASFIDPSADARINQHCPNARIVLIVRDPLEWCLSFYSQFKTFDYTTPDFKTFSYGHLYKHGEGQVELKFDDNFVPKRISAMMEAFGDRLLILSYRMIKSDREKALKYIEEFTGLQPFFSEKTLPEVRINASGRRNIRLVSYLLSRNWVVAGAGRIGTPAMVQKLRGRFDEAGAQKVKTRQELYSKEELAHNADMFTEQQAWVDELFKDSLALTSDRKPYVLSDS